MQWIVWEPHIVYQVHGDITGPQGAIDTRMIACCLVLFVWQCCHLIAPFRLYQFLPGLWRIVVRHSYVHIPIWIIQNAAKREWADKYGQCSLVIGGISKNRRRRLRKNIRHLSRLLHQLQILRIHIQPWNPVSYTYLKLTWRKHVKRYSYPLTVRFKWSSCILRLWTRFSDVEHAVS